MKGGKKQPTIQNQQQRFQLNKMIWTASRAYSYLPMQNTLFMINPALFGMKQNMER